MVGPASSSVESVNSDFEMTPKWDIGDKNFTEQDKDTQGADYYALNIYVMLILLVCFM